MIEATFIVTRGDPFETRRKLHALPRVGETVFLQFTIAGDAPVDLIPWKVERIEHFVVDADPYGNPWSHAVKVYIA